MKLNWLRILTLFLLVLIVVLFWQLFTLARATAVANLIITILTPLNGLLILALLFTLIRSLVKLYSDRKGGRPGFRLKTKLVLAVLPLTLVPAMMMFFFASQLPERVLGGLSVERHVDTLVRQSEALSASYLRDIGGLLSSHGPSLFDLWEKEDRDGLAEYMARFGIPALDVFDQRALRERFRNPGFGDRLSRRLRLVEPGVEASSALFDDGLGIWRFPWSRGDITLVFIYVHETPHTEHYRFVAESYAGLNMLEKEKESVSGLYQSTLMVIALAVTFGGIWLGLSFSRGFINAFNQLIRGAEAVGKGDFDTRIELRTGDEIEEVVHAFNAMTAMLKKNQEELKEKACDLEQVNTRLSNQIHYTQTLLHEVRTGIVSTDTDGQVLTANPAAVAMLNLQRDAIGEKLNELLDPLRHQGLLQQWTSFLSHHGAARSCQLELGDPSGGNAQIIHSTMVPLSEAREIIGCLIVLEDLTPLVHAQRLAAWREVARRVAHEIKNPLTPIQLSIQRIRRKADQQAPDLNQAIGSAYETIMSETDILKNLVNEFSTFAKLPAPHKEEVDLGALVDNVCLSYRDVFPNLSISAVIDPQEELNVRCDPSQIRQVLSNLINNAAQVSPPDGEVKVVVERYRAGSGGVDELVLQVIDEGEGIPEADRRKIFIPYFSKSAKGTGLGLAIVKRIVEDHDGRIEVREHSPRGACFEIRLPHASQQDSA